MSFFKSTKASESKPKETNLTSDEKRLSAKLYKDYNDSSQWEDKRAFVNGRIILVGLSKAQEIIDEHSRAGNSEPTPITLIMDGARAMYNYNQNDLHSKLEQGLDMLEHTNGAARLLLTDERLAKAILEGYLGIRMANYRYESRGRDDPTIQRRYERELDNMLNHLRTVSSH